MYDIKGFTKQSNQLYININSNMSAASIGNNTPIPTPPTPPSPTSDTPMQLLASANAEFMVELTADFAGLGNFTYLIDNNADHPLAWTTICTQADYLVAGSNFSCSEPYSSVTESLDTNLVTGGGPYSPTVQGGYTTAGQNLRNNLTVLSTNSSSTAYVNMYAAEYILGNAW